MKYQYEDDRQLPNNFWNPTNTKEQFGFETFDLTEEKQVEQESDSLNNVFNQFCIKLFHSDISPKIYLFLFFSNIVILLENIVFENTILVCILLELVVTFFFTLEVYINYVLHGAKYYRSFEGLLDTTMVSMCILFIIADGDIKHIIYMDDHRSRASDYLEITVCILRLITQSFRLARFYSRHKRTKALFGEYIALPIVNTV